MNAQTRIDAAIAGMQAKSPTVRGIVGVRLKLPVVGHVAQGLREVPGHFVIELNAGCLLR